MPQGPSGQIDMFKRELVQKGERWLIQSICRRCGAVIVGSVTETLTADEDKHVSQCHAGGERSYAGSV